jgi:predicted nuclease of predicted toxin-antitoxin system
MATFLANENVPKAAAEAARLAGQDVSWIAESSPGQIDDVVLAQSLAEGRVLITFDRDFGKLAFRLGRQATSGIILLRPRLRSPEYLAGLLCAVLSTSTNWKGHFSVVTEGRLRVVPLPK